MGNLLKEGEGEGGDWSQDRSSKREEEKDGVRGKDLFAPAEEQRQGERIGRAYLLKGLFAPVHRLCSSDVAAIAPGWPGYCLRAFC